MDFKLRPASRGQIYGRVLVFGESGHGKTYTALALALHLAALYEIDPSDVAVLDTETVESADRSDSATGSAEKYAGRPCNCNRCLRQGLMIDGFQTMIMEEGSRGPEEFCRALEVCKQAGIKIVVLDGITSEWRSLLQLVDKVKAQTRQREDGWSTARPLHNQFVTALMEYPGHVIATCRAKKESRHKKSEEGPSNVIPDQDSNVIYEYDVALFCQRGTGFVVKTRDDRLENVSSRHPGADLAEGLKRWCDDPKARQASAQRAHAATKPKSESVPKTAPNTRTDARSDPAEGSGTTQRGAAAPADGGNSNGASVEQLVSAVEDRIATLRSLGMVDLAKQSSGYLEGGGRRQHGRGLKQLLESQDREIAEENRRAAAEAVAAEDAAERQAIQDTEQREETADAAAGFSDLPF